MSDKLLLRIPDNQGNVTLKLGGRGAGTGDYNPLRNKPSINRNVLQGDKTGPELGLQNSMEIITEQDIDQIIYGG